MKMAMAILATALLLLGTLPKEAQAIRFVIDRKECVSHYVPYDGDMIHGSFVLVKSDSTWAFEHAGLDLVVEGPGGYQIYDSRGRSEDKFEIIAYRQGLYKFCFTNLSPVYETIAFDLHVGHIIPSNEEHAKDDHIHPLTDQVARLEEALYSVSFEQHWLQAQTERQSVLNHNMSKRIIYKAVLESLALISASLLQVYLLRRLFERKSAISRV